MTVNLPIGEHPIEGVLIKTCNGRELHVELGVKKDFSDWIKAQIKRAMLVENIDYISVPQKGDGGKFTAIEYHLTIDAGKHVAMLAGGLRGKAVRDYFISCEKQAKTNAPIKDPVIAATILTLMRVDSLEQEQRRQAEELARIAENVAVIEARTQPENKHFTVMGYAKLLGCPVDGRTAAALGKRCATLSRQRGLVIGDVSDSRYGAVHSYHESVLLDVLPSSLRKAA